MKLPSRVLKSRHGVFYLRVQRSGVDRRISLRTRDPVVAALAGYKLGATIAAMDIDKFKDLTPADIIKWMLEDDGDRIKITTDGSAKDHKNAVEAMKILLKDRASRYQEPQKPSSSQQASIDAAISAYSNAAAIQLRSALSEYWPHLVESESTTKTKKMARSALENLLASMHADFDMSQFNDVTVNEKWMQPRLLEVAGSTVKKELSWVRAFAEWCAAPVRKYCPAPLTLTMTASKSKNKHYSYFYNHDLKMIFDALPEAATKSWHLWLPILGLYTGARIGELAALRPEHFYDKVGLHCVHLPGTKNACAPRDIPIHPDLVKLGLLDLVKTRKNANKATLFDIAVSQQNGAGAAPSKWFSRFMTEKAKITEDNKVFHSFRHTLVDHLRQHDAPQEARMQFMGHSPGKNVHNTVYGREPLGLPALQERLVNKINWQEYCGWKPDLKKLAATAKYFMK